ncbi:MAG: YdcF family protein [Candidatus Uhrbacteria bacterium]|nr:YdcF family protein [Candidatus Uhrbacteria bacterium]
MRENSVAVVLLCGPRSPTGHTSTIRVFRAIELAKSLRTKLFIVGDAYNGEDVRHFASMAREHGLPDNLRVGRQVINHVVPVLNVSADANTQTNAEAVAHVIAKSTIREVYLVTEEYHMLRAALLLQRALKAACTHPPTVIEQPVISATPTAAEILTRENVLRTELGIHAQIVIPKESNALLSKLSGSVPAS